MAKGQQRSNKEKKKPKQDKKKLAPAPSPLSSISARSQAGAARRNLSFICATALRTRVFAHLERGNATAFA